MTNVNANDETELKDGVVAKVPMMFMDRQIVLDDGLPGGLHRPGYRYCSESPEARAARDAVYAIYDAELCSRYAAPTVEDADPAVDAPDATTREEAYTEYDQRIRDAWKGN